MNQLSRPVIFFDGGCPLCRKEISHYQKLDKTARIDWVDIHTESQKLKQYQISYDAAMSRIHGINTQGEILTGLDTFLMLWQELDYYRHLACFIGFFHLTTPLARAYDRFARWRLNRRCGSSCSK